MDWTSCNPETKTSKTHTRRTAINPLRQGQMWSNECRDVRILRESVKILISQYGVTDRFQRFKLIMT